MAPLFEIVTLFSTPGAYLAEIRTLEHAHQAPGNKTHQWLWIEEGSVKLLLPQIVAMDNQQAHRRTFAQAQLDFDEHRATLRWSDGEAVALTTLAFDKFPATLVRLVNLHLT